jgi:hypothetical protein
LLAAVLQREPSLATVVQNELTLAAVDKRITSENVFMEVKEAEKARVLENFNNEKANEELNRNLVLATAATIIKKLCVCIFHSRRH